MNTEFNLAEALANIEEPKTPHAGSRKGWSKDVQKEWTDRKRQYSDDLSREFSKALEVAFRSHFPNTQSGAGVGINAASAEGIKSVDVAFNIEGLFLGLGVSVKVVGLPEEGHGYTHNFKRLTEEWTTETILYHRYMPAAIIVGMLFLPNDCTKDREKCSSLSFACEKFRGFQGRESTTDHSELMEKIYVGLFDRSPERSGWVRFVDVATEIGPREVPSDSQLVTLEEIKSDLVKAFRRRNPKLRVIGMPKVT
jgi:hypothetical protein